MNNLREYLTDLAIQAGFTPDQYDEIIAELEPILLSRIMVKLSFKLPPLERELAESLVEQGESDIFWELAHKNIPDLDQYFITILEDFEEEYLSAFK